MQVHFSVFTLIHFITADRRMDQRYDEGRDWRPNNAFCLVASTSSWRKTICYAKHLFINLTLTFEWGQLTLKRLLILPVQDLSLEQLLTQRNFLLSVTWKGGAGHSPDFVRQPEVEGETHSVPHPLPQHSWPEGQDLPPPEPTWHICW